MNDVTKDKAIKLTVKILVPAKDHPKFNFVGKLLGPKGNSLKRLQEETMTKMAILGRGSMRDKQKEEELRLSGDQKFNHLSEDLHVEVAALAPPAEAHARIAYALTEIRRYLVPDYNDDIRKEQMREMQLLNNSTTSTSNSSMVSNTESSTNNGTMNNISDEGSCSPHTNEGDCLHQSPPHTEDRVKSISSSSSTSPSKGTNPSSSSSVTGSNMNTSHPVFPVLTRSHTSISSANKDPSNSSRARVKAQSRRSVLSLLTKAKAIQQKEHEYMGVFHDMASYNVYEHLGEIPINDGSSEELLGRSGGAIKVTTSPTDRARFRHDPYPRIASST